MNTRATIILAVTGLAVVGAFAWRAADRAAAPPAPTAVPADAVMPAPGHAVADAPQPTPTRPVPRLVELGSDNCHSCRAMIPVLEELRRDNGHALQVDFIDVWKDPDGAKAYDVTIIPTQVLLAPDGTELFRHTGFFSADAIRARFRELGHPVDTAPAPTKG